MRQSGQITLRHPFCTLNIDRKVSSPVPQTVTYHDACHLCHGQKITCQPRQVLAGIPGLKLVELPESTWCCGSAGIYNGLTKAAGELVEAGTRAVVVPCPLAL